MNLVSLVPGLLVRNGETNKTSKSEFAFLRLAADHVLYSSSPLKAGLLEIRRAWWWMERMLI